MFKKRKKNKKGSELPETIVSKLISDFENLPIHSSDKFIKMALNWAIYNGKQVRTTNRAISKLVGKALPKPPVKHQSKLNVTTSNVDITVAKLLKEQPIIRAVPAGKSDKDKSTAQIASDILENAFGQSDLNLLQKSSEVLTVAGVMATGWWKIAWDGEDDGGRGDIKVQTHDGFQVFPNPDATDYYNMTRVYHVYLTDKSVIENAYPDLPDLNDFPSEKEKDKYVYLQTDPTAGMEGRVLVTEVWERPSAMFKHGRKVVIINKKYLAEDKENPYYKLGKYCMPFIPFYWKKSHDDINGVSMFDDAVIIQDEINTLASVIMDNAIKMSKILWLVPKGSGITKEQLASESGGILEYNAASGGAPVQGTPSSLPAYIPSHLSALIGMQRDWFGIPEVSMGQLPERGSQMSGSALKLLIDSDQVRHSPTMRLLKTSLKIFSYIYLLMVKEFMSEKRILSLVGESQGYKVEEFTGNKDLQGEFSIVLFTGSAFNTSPAAKLEGMFNLWDRGILSAAMQGDPAAQKILAALDFGDMDYTNVDDLHRDKANAILRMIVDKKQVPPISTLDDHKIHSEVFNNYRLTKEYEELAPNIKGAIDARVEAHMRLLAEQRQQEQQAAQLQQGQQQPAPAPSGQSPAAMGEAMSMGGEG